MIIAKTNHIFGSNVSLISGTVSDGDINNLTNSNFSQSARFTGNFEISLGTAYADHVAIHGIKTFGSGSFLVSITDGSTAIKGAAIGNANFTDVFISFEGRSFFDLRIKVLCSYETSTAYIAAGLSTEVPNGGAAPGRILPYLQNNYASKSTTNQFGQPTRTRLKKTSPKISLSLSNMPIEWARIELKSIFSLYNQTQVVSFLDFASEDEPFEAWAGFEMSETTKTYTGTRMLAVVTLSFKAAT